MERQDEWLAAVDAEMPGLLERHAVPGLALAAVAGGRVAALRGYGAMRPDTELNVASLSKPVTAWGVLRLAERHGLDLDAPALPLLRGWAPPPGRFDPAGITARRLLSHTAGLSMPSVPWLPADSEPPSVAAVLRGEAGDRGALAIERAPGSAWAYSGGGYALLELLAEAVSGAPFADFMRASVLAPLGMAQSAFAPPAGPRAGVGHGEDGAPVPPYRIVGAAAGGLTSTAADLARLLCAYRPAGGEPPGRGVVSPEMLALACAPLARVELPGVETGGAACGLGHFVHRRADGGATVFHSGGNPGVRAYMLLDLERGDGLALLADGDGAVPLLAAALGRWGAAHGGDLPALF